MAISLYGIPNCDSVKKARAWLAAQGIDHHFIDFKKTGAPADRLSGWASAVSWDKLINRQGTTWRKLSSDGQAEASSPAGALALALAQPSVIKRPVVEWPNGDVTVGFNATVWAESLHALPK